MTRHSPRDSAAWEADVVLRDGRTARLRAIQPSDVAALRQFHASLSDQSVYFRFFAPHPELTDDEVRRFTEVDQVNRVALVVTMRGTLMGVGRYDRLSAGEAEVAFVIRDDLQGLGLGSLLLEHLAAVARDSGIQRFVADVLPANGRMLATFRYAGYAMTQRYDEGVVSLSLDLEPTEQSEQVSRAREHRHEARSLVPLLRPKSIVMVGVSRRPGSIGQSLLRHVITSGYSGRLTVVHPDLDQIMGIPCHRRIDQIPGVLEAPPDLAIIAVAAEDVQDVLIEAAESGVRAAIVVSGGFEDVGPTEQLAEQARAFGIRLLGPAALGVVNTSEKSRVNASLLPSLPDTGPIGFFCQSGALASDIIHRMNSRGLGIATFVSAGHRADVSGNDLLQFWEEDPDTEMVMMYLETVGNPRKFARLARRMARHTPVVVLQTTGIVRSATGHASLPAKAWRQVMSDTGVIEVSSLEQMLDVAEVLGLRGSLGEGRIGLVGNSEALETLARNAAEQQALVCAIPARTLSRGSSPHQFRRCLDEALRDDDVDVVVALYAPPVETADDALVRSVIAEFASAVAKPVLAVVLGKNAVELRALVRERRGAQLPVFTDVEHAMAALGHVIRYRTALHDEHESTHAVDGCDAVRARSVALDLLETSDCEVIELSMTQAEEILACYGLPCAQAPALSGDHLTARILGVRDPSLGPVVSFGVDAWWARELQEEAYALAPLTESEALRMIDRSVLSRGHLLDFDRRALSGYVRRVAALLHDVGAIHRVEIGSIALMGAKGSSAGIGPMIGRWEVTLTAAPPTSGDQVRRMTPTALLTDLGS